MDKVYFVPTLDVDIFVHFINESQHKKFCSEAITTIFNSELHEFGLKYHGADERLLHLMVPCENLSFYWAFYIVWIQMIVHIFL